MSGSWVNAAAAVGMVVVGPVCRDLQGADPAESRAKHRRQGWFDKRRQTRQAATLPQRRQTLAMVDRETREIHLLPRDTVKDRSTGRFPALCGYRVLPASLTDPGRRFCQSCQAAATIPSQRSR